MIEKDFRNADLNEIIEKLQVGMSFTVKFDGKLIEVLCLDISDEGKTVMLFPEMQEAFDKGEINNWKDSSIRRKLNSNVFMCKLDEEFINHTVVKEIHTCDYTTYDRFWLLSHEEVGGSKNYSKYFKENRLCKKLKYFDESDKSRCFDRMLYPPRTWWLRSASSCYSDSVGCAYRDGFVNGYYVDNNDIAVLPTCLLR